ncbi:epoxyqueuosine reductase [Balneicella halophila]|uniref:Epoxyqueuosine reductase n=1 Tax=Balneicella halophila TaxID=1537566 RepID=A0A7L4UR24_BALHA|nr:tRNA epoxyqueuosine(34) reductase QueG [Balneicella halophila]PVX52225.1 epoxyqueuosine reductase [Balneicella halophila]
MTDKVEITHLIKQQAHKLGFDGCGIARADFLEEQVQPFTQWLDANYHGDLSYMERNIEKRLDPRKLEEGTKSVIVVMLNYYTDKKQPECAPVVSKYAFGKDYHFIMKDKLNLLLSYIQELAPQAKGRYFVDSAPVLEQVWAERAGLGWIGKNSLLLTPIGSYVFIGEILLNMALDYDASKTIDPCGKCTRCIDACPTNAILPSKIINASKCISYFTIEKKGHIPDDVDIKNRLFGCDICQDVCPWNRKAREHTTSGFKPLANLMKMNREDWNKLTAHEFGEKFKGSPMKRAKYTGIKRTLMHLNKKDEPTDNC